MSYSQICRRLQIEPWTHARVALLQHGCPASPHATHCRSPPSSGSTHSSLLLLGQVLLLQHA
jgi:hypothetical protein